MNQQNEAPYTEPPAKKNRTLLIVIIVLVVLCCCCVAGVVALYYGYDYMGDPLGIYGFLPLIGQMLV